MNLFDLDDRVTAAAVAATGTVIGALIQLRAAWRNEVSARARGVPVTKKSRRGPVLAVFLLLVAAGVGGFALSQWLMQQSQRESEALRGELHTQLAQISATAERLERATQQERTAVGRADADVQAVTVTTTVGPCRARSAGSGDAACSEQEALRVSLCGSVPASAVVTDMALYARPEESPRSWSDSRVAPGQDVGQARFSDKPFERPESDQSRQVCAGFSDWDGQQAYSARLVVKYGPGPAPREAALTAREASRATVTAVSDRVP